ncbi:ATP-binding protein [Nocardioides taihuensis]|uniref:histidine kinase n=1 Tax=Nocardioides taihuensis TaxID=1835606 RepID=A0ABW0BG87_9ACTN
MGAQGSREVLALRGLHDLMTRVNAVPDLEELLRTACQGVVDVLGFRLAVINCLDAHGYLECLAVAGEPSAVEAMMGRRTPADEILSEMEIADEWGRLRFLPHDRLPPDVTSGWIPDIEPLDVPDAWHPLDTLYAPLHDPSGRLLGVLGVDLPEDGLRPGALRRQVLEMYAVQAGLALHHAQERERLSEKLRLGNAARTIVATAARELDLALILGQSVAPLVEGFECERLWVRAIETTRTGETRGRGTGHPADMAGLATPELLAVAESLARRCWADNRTVVVGGLGDTSGGLLADEERGLLVGLLDGLGGGSLLGVPLGAGPECLGYLVLIRADTARSWGGEESEAALVIGHEIGRAVLHARLFERERELNGELQELDRYKGELISTITHELKTPLTTILGHAELLEDTPAPQESVRAIARNAERLQTLAEDLLLLAKVKDPHRPMIPVPVDVSALVRETHELFDLLAQRRGVRLEVADDGHGGGIHARGDRDELERALINVVGNAIKYTPGGGSVTLAVHTEGPDVVVTCRDTGLGIAEDDHATLFDEFNRSSNPDAQTRPGSGLGLAIVKRIVDRHRGTISLESTLGEGSTFRIAVPVAGPERS